jgi:hypothetical protein
MQYLPVPTSDVRTNKTIPIGNSILKELTLAPAIRMIAIATEDAANIISSTAVNVEKNSRGFKLGNETLPVTLTGAALDA